MSYESAVSLVVCICDALLSLAMVWVLHTQHAHIAFCTPTCHTTPANAIPNISGHIQNHYTLWITLFWLHTQELICFYRNNGLITATLGSSCPWAKRLKKKSNNVTRVTDLDYQGKTGMELYVEARKSVSGVWEIPHGLSQHRLWLLSMGNDSTIESEWEMTQIHQEWRHPSPFHVKNKTCWRKREYRMDRSQP